MVNISHIIVSQDSIIATVLLSKVLEQKRCYSKLIYFDVVKQAFIQVRCIEEANQ
jgi:hypothetical protein